MPNLILLGNLKIERLPIFSFLIINPETGLYLHYNFVTKLLNDLFGIQSRSGCACAGPYGHYLLGIDEELGEKYHNKLVIKDKSSKDYISAKNEILKPGFTRFNIPFFLTDFQFNFILNAIAFISEHGWKFLPLYEFQKDTGKFWHNETNSTLNQHKIDIDLNYILKKTDPETYLEKNQHNIESLKMYLTDANKFLNSLDTFYAVIFLFNFFYY